MESSFLQVCRPSASSHRLVLPQIVRVIESIRLQIGVGASDIGEGGFGQDLGGGIGDLVNEADIAVFAGRDARDDFAPGHFGIDDGLATAPSIIDQSPASGDGSPIFLKIRSKSSDIF